MKSVHSHSDVEKVCVDVDVCAASTSHACLCIPFYPQTGLTTVQSDPDSQGSTGPRLCVQQLVVIMW